jgi:pimeloyl-ACP methyl ester carboxylesterase
VTADVRTATSADGVELHVEVEGDGPPLLLMHEVAGDVRSWDGDVERLRDRFTCIRYSARGFPPSQVPTDPRQYGQDVAVTDAVAVLDAMGVQSAHLVGLSMGGFCALHLCLTRPERVRSAVLAGVGYGSAPEDRAGFVREAEAAAAAFRADVATAARRYVDGPTRVQLRRKDPAAWAALGAALARHDPTGQALTFAQVQARRPALHDLRERLAAVRVPLLLLLGDEDDGCLTTNLMLKRTIPSAALRVLPHTGHTVNLEEPREFAAAVAWLVEHVEAGTWPERDPRSLDRGLVGM